MTLQQEGGNVNSRKGMTWRDGVLLSIDRIDQISRAAHRTVEGPDARVWRGGGDTDVHSFGRCCVHPGLFGDEGNRTTNIVGQDLSDERFAVSMVDSFALRVGENQLFVQGGPRRWLSMPGHTTTTFGVVPAISST